MEIHQAPRAVTVSPPMSAIPNLSCARARPGGEAPRPILRGRFAKRQRHGVGEGARSLRGEIGDVDGKSLIRGVAWIVVLEEMNTRHEPIGGNHKPGRRKPGQQRRVVLQAKSARMSRQRREVVRNECDFPKAAHRLDSSWALRPSPQPSPHGRGHAIVHGCELCVLSPMGEGRVRGNAVSSHAVTNDLAQLLPGPFGAFRPNSPGRFLRATLSRTPFTTPGSSPPKKSWAISTYSLMIARAGTSLCSSSS